MRIVVGSGNVTKIQAVKELVGEYEFLRGMDIIGKNVESEISEQPMSIDETIMGAMNRAKNAYEENLGIGIEDGLMVVPNTKSNYMNICVCAIYDGERYHLGISSGFEHPKVAVDLVMTQGVDMSKAFHLAKLSEKENIGSEEGAIGLLTKGRINRIEYTKQAVQMALIHLENKKLY